MTPEERPKPCTEVHAMDIIKFRAARRHQIVANYLAPDRLGEKGRS